MGVDEPSWKKVKLSLERPYKDDNGNRIPTLLDITPQGQHIYEPKESPSVKLAENLRRIFVERGHDFFDQRTNQPTSNAIDELDHTKKLLPNETNILDAKGEGEVLMTVEELYKMRMEIIPHLFVALGEMTHAKELLNSLLLSSQPVTSAEQSPPKLSATIVAKPPPILSVQAFNTQLTLGSKDEALRKAAGLFRSAAERMERGRIRNEKYWVDALKIRRANWGLIPAPLPYGSATGKGADKTSKDFLVSYGLEESLPLFRRRAIGHMEAQNSSSQGLVFPNRQGTRLCVAVNYNNEAGVQIRSLNTIKAYEEKTIDGSLKAAQREVVEQEIFSILVNDAGSLPTASARVSERVIFIEAAQAVELQFELVNDQEAAARQSQSALGNFADIIYNSLHILLLRRHGHRKLEHLGAMARNTTLTSGLPSMLQPIIDLLQYKVFCEGIETELDKLAQALVSAGVPASVYFDVVGETGHELVQYLTNNVEKPIGGEAILRIDNRHTVRLSFLSPSTLTAHLSEATLTVSSMPQLCQLLTEEVERCLLHNICDLGKKLCEPKGGTWFIDLDRCVARWEGCVINFRISYGRNFAIGGSAFRLDSKTGKQGLLQKYSSEEKSDISLLAWVENIVKSV